jgi:hypothetical protein
VTTELGAPRPVEDIGDIADHTWLSVVRNEVGTTPVLDSEGALVIKVQSGDTVTLGGAPPDRTIRLPELGAHQSRVQLAVGSAFLQRIIVHAHRQLEELVIDALGGVGDLTLYAAGSDRTLRINGHGDLRTLRLREGSFAIMSADLVRPTTVVDLQNISVETSDGGQVTPRQLILSGRIQLRSPWQVPSSQVTSGTVIEAPNGHVLDLGIVNPEQRASDPPLEVEVAPVSTSYCWFRYLPPATAIRLRTGSLVLRHPDPRPVEASDDLAVASFLQALPAAIERLTVIGVGFVQTSWDLESPTFSPEGGELTLHMDASSNVMNASGRVALGDLRSGVLFQGSSTNPVAVTYVSKEMAHAELDRINIYDLTVGDVRRLKTTARITPWIPVSWAARKRELAMPVGTDDKGLRAQRRADFWAQFAEILSAQHASGSVQSDVRVAVMRARRKALRYGRERFWLSAYSLIGYGERILLPMVVWLAGVVLAGLAYALVVGVPYGIISVEFIKLLVRFMAGPLAILRVEELRPKNVPGSWDTVIWVGAQVLGTICLGGALIAVRKVTRASH